MSLLYSYYILERQFVEITKRERNSEDLKKKKGNKMFQSKNRQVGIIIYLLFRTSEKKFIIFFEMK